MKIYMKHEIYDSMMYLNYSVKYFDITFGKYTENKDILRILKLFLFIYFFLNIIHTFFCIN